MTSKLQNFAGREHASRCQNTHALQQPTLLDVLYNSPTFLEFLLPQWWSALSGCSKQLRHFFHSITTIIFMSSSSHIPALARGHWPVLSVIVLEDERQGGKALARQHHFSSQLQLLARLEVEGYQHKVYRQTLLLVGQQRQQLQSQVDHLRPTLCYLHKHLSGTVSTISLKESSLLITDSLVQLTMGNWPELHWLDLSGNMLSPTALSCFVKASLPKLFRLDLSMCSLDTAAMAHLVKGNWPRLELLKLSANPNLDGTAISLLSEANWTTSNLHMKCMRLHPGAVRGMMESGWRGLAWLDLGWNRIGTASILELIHSSLVSLILNGNDLAADAMAALITAALPYLRCLWLCENDLDTAATKQLCKGKWPELEMLDLCDNSLGNLAMYYLAQGQWPCLDRLFLQSNQIEACGVKFLIKAASIWTELSHLHLDMSLANPMSWSALDLHLKYLPELRRQEVSVPKNLSMPLDTEYSIWLELREVKFVVCQSSRLVSGQRLPHQYEAGSV